MDKCFICDSVQILTHTDIILIVAFTLKNSIHEI